MHYYIPIQLLPYLAIEISKKIEFMWRHMKNIKRNFFSSKIRDMETNF